MDLHGIAYLSGDHYVIIASCGGLLRSSALHGCGHPAPGPCVRSADLGKGTAQPREAFVVQGLHLPGLRAGRVSLAGHLQRATLGGGR